MTITAALALFAALWASILKRKESRLKQVRYKIKIARLKNYKSTKETYSSSSSSELSAERSKSGSPLVRRGGGVGSLAAWRGRWRWLGKIPLQLPLLREALPRQHCLPR